MMKKMCFLCGILCCLISWIHAKPTFYKTEGFSIDTAYDENSLFAAVESGNTALLSQMAAAGWDLHCRKKPYGESLLHQAARFGHASTCQTLINLKLDPNDREMYGKQSPLLLAIGLSVNSTTKEERSAALATTQVLLENGADPNLCDYKGMTPLIYACNSPTNVPLIKCLIKFKADVNARTATGYTALEMAMRINHRGYSDYRLVIIELLLKNGANPNPGGVHFSPIGEAIVLNDLEAFKLLIKYGAEVNKESMRLLYQLGRPEMTIFLRDLKP